MWLMSTFIAAWPAWLAILPVRMLRSLRITTFSFFISLLIGADAGRSLRD
jgi:hypothetical protein